MRPASSHPAAAPRRVTERFGLFSRIVEELTMAARPRPGSMRCWRSTSGSSRVAGTGRRSTCGATIRPRSPRRRWHRANRDGCGGGWRFRGRFPFSSGCDHAQWAIVGAFRREGDRARRLSAGAARRDRDRRRLAGAGSRRHRQQIAACCETCSCPSIAQVMVATFSPARRRARRCIRNIRSCERRAAISSRIPCRRWRSRWVAARSISCAGTSRPACRAA